MPCTLPFPQDGYFRIVRGNSECGIEDDVVGGLPSSRRLGEDAVGTTAASGTAVE